MKNKKNIIIIGTGEVGMSITMMLKLYMVTAVYQKI
jgi:prephenate dehydrogenase